MGEKHDRVDIWIPEDSLRLAPIVDALRSDGHRVGGHATRPGRAVLIDVAPPRARSMLVLNEVLAARRRGQAGLVAVLAPHDTAGARWLAEGADDYGLEAEPLLARLRSRLRVRAARVGAGALSLRAAAELALGEAERAADASSAALWVLGSGDARCFARVDGVVTEKTSPGPALRALCQVPGPTVFRLADPSVPAEVRGGLDPGAEAVLVLGLTLPGADRAVIFATVRALPSPAQLAALAALAEPLGRVLRGAESVEEACLGRYRDLLDANRRLRELSHAKDEFLAVCAHDLRSPLTALLSHVELLAQGQRGALSGPAKSSVATIHRQAVKMSELIQSLLAERALETGILDLRRAATDPAQVLDECLEEAIPAAAERGVTVVSRGLAPEVDTIEVDAPRIREAVGNLLANAIKYTPRGGTVELSLERAPGAAVIAIRDTGPGIAPDELPTLFDRYRRGRTGRAVRGGVGLGLSWAREVVRLHGGTIEVHSALGEGTTFTIRLPQSPSEERLDLRPDPERARVLVVEDDADVRAVMAELLRQRFDVLVADDGEAGVRLAKAERPDAVLMDLFMPRLDGFAALEDLRSDPRTVDIPVIFLSGSEDEQVKLKVLGLGAADYLVKPFSPRELVARVEKALESSRQRRAIAALAQIDALTGLPNYGAFRVRLEEELARAERYRTPLSAVMVDLDRLKQLNDAHGHDLGNRAIAALADHLRANLRGSDFAARFGGDEFVVLLPHTLPADAAVFAERVRAGLAQLRLSTPSGEVALQASFGVAALSGPRAPARSLATEAGAQGADDALRRADQALYAAKRAGRDRVCVAPTAAEGGATADA